MKYKIIDGLVDLLDTSQVIRETINSEEKDRDFGEKLCCGLDLIDELIDRLVGIVETETASDPEISPSAD